MCGRFTRTQSWAEVVAFSRLPVTVDVPELAPSWNIAPSQAVAAIAHVAERGYVGLQARWGLRPAWATATGTAPINARSDGVAAKPFFRSAFRRRRCLVPASGWYEWIRAGSGKQPYYITRRDGDPLFFAGIWEPPVPGSELPTVAIVTTGSGAELAALHDRQPVVLEHADWTDWLTLPGEARTALEEMLHASPDGVFQYVPVSKQVNAPRNDGAQLIQPLEEIADAPAQRIERPAP